MATSRGSAVLMSALLCFRQLLSVHLLVVRQPLQIHHDATASATHAIRCTNHRRSHCAMHSLSHSTHSHSNAPLAPIVLSCFHSCRCLFRLLLLLFFLLFFCHC